jgi:hypothetical protein
MVLFFPFLFFHLRWLYLRYKNALVPFWQGTKLALGPFGSTFPKGGKKIELLIPCQNGCILVED